MLRSFSMAVVVLAAGCAFEPEGAHELSAPPAFDAWWEATTACSGLSGSFAEIRWFAVPGQAFDCPTGRCVGRWEPGHRIYIAEEWLEHEMVVRHEMLHELIGKAGHPDPPFGTGCPLTWESWRQLAPDLSAPLHVD